MKIKNYEKVLEKLTAMLMQFAKDLNQYQTDVYLYYDEETEEAKLDTFINVGGNSRLNDEHYTIYHDKEHHEYFFEDWSISEIADILGTTEEELAKKTAEYFDYEEDEIDGWAIDNFLKKHPEYYDKLYDYYADEIETDFNDIFTEQAEEILDNFLKEMEMNEELYRDYEEMYHDYYES